MNPERNQPLLLMKHQLSLNSLETTKKFQEEKEEVKVKYLPQLALDLTIKNTSLLDITEKIQRTQLVVPSILRE